LRFWSDVGKFEFWASYRGIFADFKIWWYSTLDRIHIQIKKSGKPSSEGPQKSSSTGRCASVIWTLLICVIPAFLEKLASFGNSEVKLWFLPMYFEM
jgi:hypothetical protein